MESLELREMLSITITGFSADANSNLVVTYSVALPQPSFNLLVQRSANGLAADATLITQAVTATADLTAGSHSLAVVANFADVQQDYYLLAANSAGPSTLPFSGGIFKSGTVVHVQGVDAAAENVTISTAGSVSVLAFGVNRSYVAGSISEVHVRTHGGGDTITGSALVKPLWVYGAAGADTISLTAAASTSVGAMTFRIDGGGDNDAIVSQSPNAYQTTLLDGAAGNDVITVAGANVYNTTTLSGGAGDDVLHVGTNGTGNQSQFFTSVTVDGGTGAADRVQLHDESAPNGNYTYIVTSAALTRGSVTHSYANAELVDVFASAYNDAIYLRSTPTTATAIYARGGSDAISISSDAGANLGHLDQIVGAVTVDAGTGANSLTVSDYGAAGAANNAAITATQISGLSPAAISYSASGGSFSSLLVKGSNTLTDVFSVASPGGPLNLQTGGGNDLVTLTGAAAAAAITVDAGAADDTIQVGAPGGGNLGGFLSAVTVNGGAGADALLVDDALGAGGVYAISAGAVVRGATVNYSNAESLSVNASANADTLNVTAISIPTAIDSGASGDAINVSSDGAAGLGNLNGIAAALTLDAGSGANTLLISDYGETATANAGVTVSSTQVSGLAGAANESPIAMQSTGGAFSQITLRGSNTLPDSITAAAHAWPLAIHTYGGADTIQVGAPAGGNLSLLSGPVSVDAGGGNDVVTLNDQAASPGPHAYALASSSVARDGLAIPYANAESLNIYCGPGNDQISILSTGANLAATIDGAAGNDRFSVASTASLAVTLQGGIGDDVFAYEGAASMSTKVVELPGGGKDTLDFSALRYGARPQVDLRNVGGPHQVAASASAALTLDLSQAKNAIEGVQTIVRLTEGSRLITADGDSAAYGASTTFAAPDRPTPIRIDFSNLQFDATSGNPGDRNDAFELALLGPNGQSVVPTIGRGSNAFFNWTQSKQPLSALGVESFASPTTASTAVVVDLRNIYADNPTLAPGSPLTLVARLVNNDSDTATTVDVNFNVADVVPAQAGTIVIDDFSASQSLSSSGSVAFGPVSSVVHSSSVVGGSRTLTLSANSANPLSVVNVVTLSGIANYESGAASSGQFSFTYDADGAGLGSLLHGVTKLRANVNTYNSGTQGHTTGALTIADYRTTVTFPFQVTAPGWLEFSLTSLPASELDLDHLKSLQLTFDSLQRTGADFTLDAFQALVAAEPASRPLNYAISSPLVASLWPSPPVALRAGSIDFSALENVTSSFDIDYGYTGVQPTSIAGGPANKVSFTADLVKIGDVAVRDHLLLAIRGAAITGGRPPLPGQATLVQYDGLLPVAVAGLPAGTPYFDLSELRTTEDAPWKDATGRFVTGQQVADLWLPFLQPAGGNLRFPFELVVLGAVNRAPEFVTTPIMEVRAGQSNGYRYSAVAIDPDRDVVSYELVAAPSGMTIHVGTGEISWPIVPSTAESVPIAVRSTDPAGLATTQRYLLRVVAAGNRPPQFTSTPAVDAFVGAAYQYGATATDPDGDALVFSNASVVWPAGFTPTAGQLIQFADLNGPERGEFRWTPPAALLGKAVTITERVDDGHGATADRTFQIFVHANPDNAPPLITSTPATTHHVPAFSHPAEGAVTPTQIFLDLGPGQTATVPVTVAVPSTTNGLKVDVFMLFDDTGSFSSVAGQLTMPVDTTENSPLQMQQVIAGLLTALPGVDLAFGVGRFEDFRPPIGYEDDRDLPFILNQPMLAAGEPPFDAAIRAALLRANAGDGGDAPESSLDALYQVATGFGIDGNNNQSTADSGPAGSLSAQQVGEFGPFPGDVPAYATFQENPSQHIYFPTAYQSETGYLGEGGVGFRPDALKLVLLFTDSGFHYSSEPTTLADDDPSSPNHPNHDVVGLGTTVKRSQFIGDPEDPEHAALSVKRPGYAAIQATVAKLNELQIQVIGLGANTISGDSANPLSDPRRMLQALAKLTGAVNRTGQFIDSGDDHDIGPNEPLYFDLTPPGAAGVAAPVLASGISTAIQAAVMGYVVEHARIVPTDVLVVSDDGGIQSVNQEGIFNFSVQFTGDGQTHSFDLHFFDADRNLMLPASIPVVVNQAYFYEVDAIDPDGDALAYDFTLSDGAIASFDPVRNKWRIDWAPTQAGSFPFQIRVTDAFGNFDEQAFTVDVTDSNAGNLSPTVASVAAAAEVDRELDVRAAANDANQDLLRYFLAQNAGGTPLPAGLSIAAQTGAISWKPTLAEYNALPLGAGGDKVLDATILVYDGRGGVAQAPLHVDLRLPARFLNQPPTFVTHPTTGAVPGARYSYPSRAVDPDGDPVRYVLVDGPRGLAIDATTGLVSWEPTALQVGSHRIVLRAEDDLHASRSQIFDVRVFAPSDPPSITSKPPSFAKVGALLAYQVVAHDPNGEKLRFELDPAFASGFSGLTIGSASGVLSGTPNAVGDFRLGVRVVDEHGASASQSFVVTVASNAAPTITSVPVLSGRIGGLYDYLIGASDPDAGDAMGLTVDLASQGRGMRIGADATGSRLIAPKICHENACVRLFLR